MLKLNQKPIIYSALIWLAGILLVNTINFQVNQQTLKTQMSSSLTSYFLITLEEAMFSNMDSVVNDRNAITHVGKIINGAILGFIGQDWFSGTKNCSTAVLQIDNVKIETDFQTEQFLSVVIPRNKIERVIDIGFTCELQISTYLSWTVIWSAVFFLLYFYLSFPLSAAQLDWKNYLAVKGYNDLEASQLCKLSIVERLALNDSQQRCYDGLHSLDQRNHQYALEIASGTHIAAMNHYQVEWFIWALEHHLGDIEQSIHIAQAPDIVEINLLAGSLTIHGASISVQKTPLLYYAWYATKRLSGEGWLVNPRSNKPDYAAVDELSALMYQFSGHAKAISDLENSGLKARTLDQNRSKIKDEIIVALGEKLALPYLFQSKKDPETHRMSYRLSLPKEQFKIMT